MEKKHQSQSPTQTKRIGKKIAQEIREGFVFLDQALVLALVGDLGGGKTTFLKGFAKGLQIKQRILSPTFVIIKKYPLDRKGQNEDKVFSTFYHIDCYRIEDPQDLLDLGFKEIISSPKNLVAIEWADRVKELIPSPNLRIEFSVSGRKKRQIIIQWKK